MNGDRPGGSGASIARGPIAWMAQNSVAANLLMLVLLVGGLMVALDIKQEVFPEIEANRIVVTVAYPGASPAEVEQGISLAVEEAVRGLDGVKRVIGQCNEGIGRITVELLDDADTDRALSDVKGAVDRIVTFPLDAERPQVFSMVAKRLAISLIVYGHHSEATLREIAEDVRVGLLQRDEISQIEVVGTRPREIAIEVSQANLRAYGLTLEQIAGIVRRSSVELPGGSVKTEGGEILVRTAERRDLGEEFAEIVVLARPDGTQVRLGDIARVADGFSEIDRASTFNGAPAVKLTVFRVGDQTPTEVAQAVRDYIAENAEALPPGTGLATWDDMAEMYTGRVDLLTRNAVLGLSLVFLVLGTFLQIRLAFWVMVGIAVSFLGAFILLPMLDVSLNMISLFAFIVVLGIVVDDAIVVAENVHEKHMHGFGPMDGAIKGAREVSKPVVFAVLTTIAAFSPLLFVPGFMGKIFRMIPGVVIPVLFFSMVESLLILPAHLGHLHQRSKGVIAWIDRQQGKVARILEWLIVETYMPTAKAVASRRYLTLCVAIGMLAIAGGYVGGGHIQFGFMPSMEADLIVARARLPVGANVGETLEVQQRIADASAKVLADHGGAEGLSRGLFASLGQSASGGGPGGVQTTTGSHLTDVSILLVPSDQRSVGAADFAREWRAAIGEVPGVESMNFSYSLAHGGAAIDVQITHRDVETLERTATEVAAYLERFEGVADIDAGFSGGKDQIDLQLKPDARGLGMTETDLGRQLRSAFYGAEALRQQRGREEVRVMVRLPKSDRVRLNSLETLMMRAPNGGEIPLGQAATLVDGRAYTSIKRVDGRRAINVTADIEKGKANANEVVAELREELLPALAARTPGLHFGFEGEQREQRESLQSLGMGFLIALLVIYALLAVPFRSYSQPLIIMSVIPFGLIGALVGHVLLGFNLSVISMMGVVALSGVVVNDSLVLIVATNQLREQGLSPFEAVVRGGVRRFRPILLTSLTTFFGLIPMIFEPSLQARFLIPMAISLGFGVLFATFIVLLLVPALYLILEDIRWVIGIGEGASAKVETVAVETEPAGVET